MKIKGSPRGIEKMDVEDEEKEDEGEDENINDEDDYGVGGDER